MFEPSPRYQNFSGSAAGDLTDDDETPHEVNVVPETNQSRWSPIEDLDSFFSRMYRYHQSFGYLCIILDQGFGLVQFLFIICFTVFLFHWVDYPILFRDKIIANDTTKISLSDAILPKDQAFQSMGFITWSCLSVAFIFWILRVISVFYEAVKCWETRTFYYSVLNIPDEELENVTWHEVQRKLLAVQKDHEMCIHKKELTELDICHRILRFKNYMVALVNKDVIPVTINVPIFGATVFLSRGYKYNLELLFFRCPWSPFENSWHLRDDYKRVNKRKELAESLNKHILWLAFINLALCPIILLWQILFSFFNYAELIKRQPGRLGLRSWSLYGRLYLRHFNELDHELNGRLSRAYRPATKYMNMFTSPVLAIVARNVQFFVGCLFAVLFLLSVWDEDVLAAQHVLTDLTLLATVIAVASLFVPDENLVWCPEQLMTAVLAHVHYLPDSWKGLAHTANVRNQFANMFQYISVYWLHELLSPIITPYMLMFYLRPRSLAIVDFFRQFSVDVVGVGDVCSFAQMDIRRHGNTAWQPPANVNNETPRVIAESIHETDRQAEMGKTELSLINFTLTNPSWRPPEEAERFVRQVRTDATRDFAVAVDATAAATAGLSSMHSTLSSTHGGGGGLFNLTQPYGNSAAPYDELLAASYLHLLNQPLTDERSGMESGGGFHNPFGMGSSSQRHLEPTDVNTGSFILRGAINRSIGPAINEIGLGINQQASSFLPTSRMGGIMGVAEIHNSLGASMFGQVGPETTRTDMAISALYLHNVHHRQFRRRGYTSGESSMWQLRPPRPSMAEIAEQPDDRRREKLPLLQHKS